MEIKADNETLRRYFCWVDLSTHAPDKCLGIEIIRPEQALSPALAPYAEQLDDGPEILAGRRQPVEMAVAAGFRLDMHDPKLLKLLETLSQHCSRYRGCGLEQLSEGPGAEAQLPYDDRAPAVAKDLGSLRDGAELRIHDYMARIKHEFDRRNTKIIGLSVDALQDHSRWANDIATRTASCSA